MFSSGMSASCEACGLLVSGLGTHSSRTMMLNELTVLLGASLRETSADELRFLVVEQNVLGKRTMSTRLKSFRHLRELYALDPGVLVYHALRQLWDADVAARPLLAVLVAVGRDPALRATADVILNTLPGDPVSATLLADAAQRAFPQLSVSTANKIGRNCASTWTQSGHLIGHVNKHRQQVTATPVALTMALLLAQFCGLSGNAMLASPWVQLLDVPPYAVRDLAVVASRQGWLEYRYSGDVTEVTFHHLMGKADE